MNQANPSLQNRISVLRWTMPIVLGGPAVCYETILPVSAFLLLTALSRWLVKAERAQQQAQASERRLGAIMAASADAILSLDADGRIESWNRGAELLFGYPAHDMRG